MPNYGNLRIDANRLWTSLEEMAKIGPGIAGGNNRQALTDEDAEGRALFARWCKGAGLELATDQMGNMFAVRPGTEPDLPAVYMGSHLDTQPTGGKYDGVLGVLAGLEVVRAMNEAGVETRYPVAIANWTNEEGARFAPPMVSSGVFAGALTLQEAYDRRDDEGKSIGEELERIGWKGSEPVGQRKMQAYYELHIEQGPVLEAEGDDIGVVTDCQGLWWLEFTLTGRAAHTGSTPMSMRIDAGLAMAKIVAMVREVVESQAAHHAMGGIGHMGFTPNSRNVLPQTVVFTVDLRCPDKAVLDALRETVEQKAEAICAELGVGCAVEAVGQYAPVHFDPDLVINVREAAEELGLKHRDIISGAGHDACWISRVAPTTMIFCPCVDGISHNEAEEITPDWAAAGANVLLQAVCKTAEAS
ncbi:Zn-dependent hydrolase [Methyloligella sp. 2.7D]|uniref:Zn-dependent hydrolase n=1 Tax=unclassified Methyloligella TaxID=2625955 RepID=UPI00157BF810|nr:Zn-dependent hydrolase [Methyloligella sp. GL2]QKP76664.1 Zn-dependent hydrolase [Methyloligella sp. GL2]